MGLSGHLSIIYNPVKDPQNSVKNISCIVYYNSFIHIKPYYFNNL